jgi:hypothetical protein
MFDVAMAEKEKGEGKLVSLIFLNWNSYELTKKSIETTRKNTSYPNYEMWLVDNASSDGSFEKLKKEFPFLKTIRNAKNMGFAYAMNQGYRDAKGAYLGYMASDATVLEGWLDEMVKVLESDEKIAVVGAREINEAQMNDPAELEKVRSQPNIEKLTLPVCWLIKKEMIEKIGYMDTEYFSPAYGEESDWNFRAHNLGYKIVRVSKANAVHLGSAVIRKHVGDRKYTILINYHRLRSMLFNLSIADLLRFVPGLGLIIVNSFFTPSFFHIMKSYWLNIKDWKLIMQQRKAKRSYIPFREPKFTVVE